VEKEKAKLRPIIIDELGIVAAIEYLISEDHGGLGAQICFVHDLHTPRLTPLMEGTLFRIVQESLTNLKRHSQAESATVKLNEIEGRIRLEITDDGQGFRPEDVSEQRFGLRGIKERARLFGGEARIESSRGQGTRIVVDLPINQPDECWTAGSVTE
jgi:signal transduction histidine kinase